MTEDTDETGGRGTKVYASVGIGIVGLIVLAVVLSPLLHGVVLALYANLWIIEVIGISALVAYAAKRWVHSKREAEESTRSYRRPSERMRALQIFGIVFVALFIGGSLFTGALSGHAMGQQTMNDAQEIDRMYEADADHPRIVTRDQANRWASGSVRSSKYNPTGNSIVVYNNTTHWGSTLAPTSSLRNRLTEKQNGTVLVNAESFEKDVTVVEGEMDIGRGMAITDGIGWHVTDPSLLRSVLRPCSLREGL